MPTETAIKVQENRVRRTAQRRGLKVVKSRRRDPRATDYGIYSVVDIHRNVCVFGDGTGLSSASLDDVEAWLKDD